MLEETGGRHALLADAQPKKRNPQSRTDGARKLHLWPSACRAGVQHDAYRQSQRAGLGQGAATYSPPPNVADTWS